jgi:peroxiredoxin
MLSEEQERTTQILALSVDEPSDLQRMIDRISADDAVAPRFPFLTDTDHRVIDRYGLLNPEAPRGMKIPHPATFIIDMEGLVRWRFVEVDYTLRPSNEDLLTVLGELEPSL